MQEQLLHTTAVQNTTLRFMVVLQQQESLIMGAVMLCWVLMGGTDSE